MPLVFLPRNDQTASRQDQGELNDRQWVDLIRVHLQLNQLSPRRKKIKGKRTRARTSRKWKYSREGYCKYKKSPLSFAVDAIDSRNSLGKQRNGTDTSLDFFRRRRCAEPFAIVRHRIGRIPITATLQLCPSFPTSNQWLSGFVETHKKERKKETARDLVETPSSRLDSYSISRRTRSSPSKSKTKWQYQSQ